MMSEELPAAKTLNFGYVEERWYVVYDNDEANDMLPPTYLLLR